MSPRSMSTATAPVAGSAEAMTVARAAAEELTRLLPSTVPLTVASFDPSAGPSPDALVVRASFVGAVSAEVMVVADEAVATALAGADQISLADALRPALEAATATLGAGVLDATTAAPVGDALAQDGVTAVALADPSGTAQAWFGMHLRQAAPPVPHQRGEGGTPVHDERAAMRLLNDVEMTLTAEIGRTLLPVRQVLELVPGTVLELDRAAGAPADVMVNGRLVARGEVVVVDEDYGIRITEIVSAEHAG